MGDETNPLASLVNGEQTTAVATIDDDPDALRLPNDQDVLAVEAAVMRGSYGALTVSQRLALVKRKCDLLGVKMEHGPFQWGTLNNKLALIPTKNLSQQLRDNRKLRLDILEQVLDEVQELFIVRTRVTAPDGRYDEDMGIVSMPRAVKGEARANLMMVAVTKAKNRVTLSFCGVGGIDETEIAQVAGSSMREPSSGGPQVIDPNRGKIRVERPPAEIPNAGWVPTSDEDLAAEAAVLAEVAHSTTVSTEAFIEAAAAAHAPGSQSKPSVPAPPRPKPSGAPRASAVAAPHTGRPPAGPAPTKSTSPAPKPPTKAPVRARRG